jgi:hypothetical protein
VSLPSSDTFTATSITFSGPGSTTVEVGTYFDGLANNCIGCVSFTNSTWTAGGGAQTLTVTNGALTDMITLTNYAFSTAGNGDLSINGSGTSQINGGVITPIVFSLTSQLGGANPGDPVSYSASLSTVPLPGALPLFATGLAGLGMLRLRRKKARKA